MPTPLMLAGWLVVYMARTAVAVVAVGRRVALPGAAAGAFCVPKRGDPRRATANAMRVVGYRELEWWQWRTRPDLRSHINFSTSSARSTTPIARCTHAHRPELLACALSQCACATIRAVGAQSRQELELQKP